MTGSRKARVIEAEELKEIINETVSNPTIERLMFIEAKAAGTEGTKVFPCYLEAWGQEENAKVKIDPGLRFQMCIVQSVGGEFGLVRVVVLASDLGVTKRIWDLPPTKDTRDDTPWVRVEEGVQ